MDSLLTLDNELANNVRRQSLNGREYVVADVIMLKEGVLNGSKGPLYYPSEEIAKRPGIWNGFPLTANHPSDTLGNPISARSPDAWQRFTIGHVFNDTYNEQTTERSAQAWIDVEIANKINPKIVPTVLSGQKINVSTGLFTNDEILDNVRQHKGKDYKHIARNYQPDHLAVLLNDQGACSVKDGCGININASTLDKKKLTDISVWLSKNGAMPGYGQVFVRGSEVWYVGGDGDDWSEKNLPIKKFGAVEGVTKVHYEAEGFPPKDSGWVQVNNSITEATTNMRKELVSWLVTNCDCYKGKDAVLNDEKSFTDAELTKLKENAEAATLAVNTLKKIGTELSIPADTTIASLPEVVKNKVADAKKSVPEMTDDEKKKAKEKETAMNAETFKANMLSAMKSMNEAEYLTHAPPAINALITNAKQVTEEKKIDIIKALVANIKDDTTKKAKILALNAKSLEQLVELRELIGDVTPANNKTEEDRILANYFGANGGNVGKPTATYNRGDILLPSPAMNGAGEEVEVVLE